MQDELRDLTLEELQEKLDEEAKEWEANGIAMNNVGNSNESLFILKQQNQAMMNLLLQKEIVTEDELNKEFKIILYHSMVTLRGMFLESRAEQVKGMIRPGMALPQHKLIGPDGKDIIL